MLVLTRQVEEDIFIGPAIRLKVLGIHGNQVRLGIEAPADVRIYRGELVSAVREQNEAAVRRGAAELRALRAALGKKATGEGGIGRL